MIQLFAFIVKEARHILRDRRTLIILIGMPIAQVLLFGYAITNEIRGAKIAILDLSKDEYSTALVHRMLSSDFFTLESYLNSHRELPESFKAGKTKLALIFPPDYQESLETGEADIQIIADATDPNTATTLLNYAGSIITSDAKEKLNMESVPFDIRIETNMLYNRELKSVFMFVPGVVTIILMLISAMMTSIAITREKETGTMEVLLSSPVRPFIIILGKVIPYIILAFLTTLIVLSLATFVFAVPIRGNAMLLLGECLLFVITCLAIGILISTRTKTQQVALLISLMGLMLPTILLSGFIFPIENMPLPLQWLSNLIPARWFILVLKDIMLKGLGWPGVMRETIIMAGMAILFIAISTKNFKIRLG